MKSSLLLRSWQLTDVPNLVHYANNANIANNLTDGFPHPYTETHAQQFIQMAANGNPVTIMAITIDGVAVGGIGLHLQHDIFRNNAELGYWLAEPFWGKGIVTEAIRQMVHYGFQQLPINRIFARPFGRNTASQRVLEKVGFVLEAKFEKTLIKNGILEDELVYAIRKL